LSLFLFSKIKEFIESKEEKSSILFSKVVDSSFIF
jgi:hypothetical protein